MLLHTRREYRSAPPAAHSSRSAGRNEHAATRGQVLLNIAHIPKESTAGRHKVLGPDLVGPIWWILAQDCGVAMQFQRVRSQRLDLGLSSIAQQTIKIWISVEVGRVISGTKRGAK
jgi:hypothetical protein